MLLEATKRFGWRGGLLLLIEGTAGLFIRCVYIDSKFDEVVLGGFLDIWSDYVCIIASDHREVFFSEFRCFYARTSCTPCIVFSCMQEQYVGLADFHSFSRRLYNQHPFQNHTLRALLKPTVSAHARNI